MVIVPYVVALSIHYQSLFYPVNPFVDFPITLENVIPLDHVDDLPVVEPNQPDVVPIILEPVLVDEDEDLEAEEFKEEEEPQEEDDMDIDEEEDENEPELMLPYEEADPLNPLPPASDSEPKDVIEVEDTFEPEDKTVPASVHEVGEWSTSTFLQEDGDRLLPGFMRSDIGSLFGRIASFLIRVYGREMAHAIVKKKRKAKDKYYGKLIADLGNEVRSSVEEGAASMENLVRKLGNAEERNECKKLKKELEESRGVMFEERLNEAIDVPVEDEKSPSSEPIMPLKSAPLTQAAIRRMIKESVDAAIDAERARQANTRNNASGSGQARGAVELRRWFEKTKMTFRISKCAKDKKVKFTAATLRGPALTWWNSKFVILGLDVANQMVWTKMKKLMTAKLCNISLKQVLNDIFYLR
ncbi:hypothetical protein Tco_0449584 [Tanacetum coccineum]